MVNVIVPTLDCWRAAARQTHPPHLHELPPNTRRCRGYSPLDELRADLLRLAEQWEAEADANEDEHRQGPAIARAVRFCATELRNKLDPPAPAVPSQDT